MNQIILRRIQKILGYHFNQQSLLKKALTHRSASSSHNERLEFLGDSILSFIITKALYKKFRNISEGEMSRMRAFLVRGKTLAKIAYKFNLGKYLQLGQGEIKNGGKKRKSILANSLEAIIASIFLDSNIKTIENVILKWYNKKLKKINPKNANKDPKTKLQEYLQSKGLPLPLYFIKNINGEAHNQTFLIKCKIFGINKKIMGVGSSRRKAEQLAAKKALITLRTL